METIFCQEGMTGEECFAQWRALAGQHLPSHLQTEDPGTFRATARRLELGELFVLSVDLGPLTEARTHRHILSGGPETYQVYVPRSGAVRLSHGKRGVVVEPGSLLVHPTWLPWESSHDAASGLRLFVPRDRLALSVRELKSALLRPIPTVHGVGALLPPVLAQLAAQSSRLTGDSPHRLGGVVADLLEAIIVHSGGDGAAVESPQGVPLFLEIRRFVTRHLSDPELTVEAIASANFISVRYLHRLFQERGLTVAGFIRRQRLECCARDLVAGHPLPVHEIAARWGFRAHAAFSRSFRAAYGTSPREYRSLKGRPDLPDRV